MNTMTDGRDVYRVVSRGMSLPPLRVNRDGTYSWRVLANGSERVIDGRWVAREDGPGIILLAGDEGRDWTVTNATDRSTLRNFGRAEIHLTTPEISYMTGRRIVTEGVASAAVGDAALLLRDNGALSLMNVIEAGNGRYRVQDSHKVLDQWVTLDRLRRLER